MTEDRKYEEDEFWGPLIYSAVMACICYLLYRYGDD